MGEEALSALLAAGRDGGPSPGGAYRAAPPSGFARNRIELAGSGGPIAVLEGKWLRTVCIAFSAHERWIAASGFAGGVMVWETATGAMIASFPDVEADPAGDGRLPLVFARGDGLLVCGGRRITFIDTAAWTPVCALDQPAALLTPCGDLLRVDAYEAVDGGFTRWTINMKSFGYEAADRLRQTRVYRMLLDRKAS